MKKLLLLLFILLLPLCAAAEGATLLRVQGAWEAPLDAAAAESGWDQAVPESGYALLVDGQLRYAQVLIHQDGLRALWCAEGENGRVRTTVSSDAVPQQGNISLWTQAAAEEWDDDSLTERGACEAFDLIAEDIRLSFESEADGWQLRHVVLPVASVSVGDNAYFWNDETVLHTQPVSLADFRLNAFPRTLAEARRLEAAALQQAETATVSASAFPDGVLLWSGPSDQTEAVARVYDGVPALVLDRGSGYVYLQIGEVTGWISESLIRMGANGVSYGLAAQVRPNGAVAYRSLWREAADTADRAAELSVCLPLRVMSLTLDGAWAQICLSDGMTGWMRTEDLLPDTAQLLYTSGSKAEERISIRKSPEKKGELIARCFVGTGLQPLLTPDAPQDWTRVAWGETVGWVRSDDLSETMPAYLPPLAAILAEGGAGLYSDPSDKEPTLQLATATPVEVQASIGYWAKLRTREGIDGWVRLEKLDRLPTEAVPAAVTLQEDAAPFRAGDTVTLAQERPVKTWQVLGADKALDFPATVRVWSDGAEKDVPYQAIRWGW